MQPVYADDMPMIVSAPDPRAWQMPMGQSKDVDWVSVGAYFFGKKKKEIQRRLVKEIVMIVSNSQDYTLGVVLPFPFFFFLCL